MSYQEEEQSRLRRQSSKQAITLAMQGQWREAIAINQSIIEMFPNDVDAYNRLGRAYMELGEYAQAEAAYSRTIEIDPYNTIASKNIQRLSHLKESAASSEADSEGLEPRYFIEEIGKAGVVQLYRLAPPVVLAKTVAGDRVHLKVEGSSLIAETGRGEYLGQVDPRHGQRLVRLMEGGNRYSAAIVSSSDKMVTIIIREVYQDPGQVGRLSFPSKGLVGTRTTVGDSALRRELEYEESLLGEPGYTVIGGDEPELLHEEPLDTDDDVNELE
jgi:hypothetical protein